MERTKVGEVFHYFGHIGVAAIRLTDGALAVGDTIQVQGPSTNLTQVVETMQIEHGAVREAAKGQEVGVKLKDRARERDLVYKVLPP
ncbi:MAG TPA: EF-Tu/IF-2/RF-3 family GTPase [Thermoplasmata archaeon]|nr:EF-Tu/IF-2/RF-3 family GTPase [Thermoplasmata archaeon]